jgi:DNA processing protein
MNPEEQLKFRVALSLLPGIGPVLARSLVSYCGSAEAVFRSTRSQLERIPGIGPVTAAAVAAHRPFERAEQEADFIRRHRIDALFFTDENYPWRLKNCEDAPVLLYRKGPADPGAAHTVAVVGTRTMTSYGRELTDNLVAGLAAYGVTVVSGMAYGVDIQAHRQALACGLPTIGVLAHGLDRIYPGAHRAVAEKMAQQGALLTEYPSGTIPDRENFPARNRIVAGLCDATVVVESGLKGGALITADIANSYNRDVFAFPGRVSDAYSIGCNELVRRNKAMLVQTAAEMAAVMGWDLPAPKKTRPQLALFQDLKKEEQLLVGILQASGRTDIDTLTQRAGMPVSAVSSALLSLEFAGILKSLPWKQYELA